MIAQTPTLIQIGDLVRFESEGTMWRLEDGSWFRIPKGTDAEVVEWFKYEKPTKYQPNPCALRIKGMKHPEFKDFPMTLTFPGMPMPTNLILVERTEQNENVYQS